MTLSSPSRRRCAPLHIALALHPPASAIPLADQCSRFHRFSPALDPQKHPALHHKTYRVHEAAPHHLTAQVGRVLQARAQQHSRFAGRDGLEHKRPDELKRLNIGGRPGPPRRAGQAP